MTRLPIAVTYFFFLGFWFYLWHLSNAPSLHPIHHLMYRVLLVKALTSLTSPLDSQDDPLTQSIRISLLIALMLLLVEITRMLLVPLRQNGSKKALTAVIAAQITANVVVGEMEGVTSSAIMAFMVVNFLGGFSVLGILVWHVEQMREELKGEKKQETRRAVDRVRIFLQSYMMVLALSYVTKLLLFPLRRVSGAVEEISSLVCYAVVFYWFRPEAMNKSEYFHVVEDEETEKSVP